MPSFNESLSRARQKQNGEELNKAQIQKLSEIQRKQIENLNTQANELLKQEEWYQQILNTFSQHNRELFRAFKELWKTYDPRRAGGNYQHRTFKKIPFTFNRPRLYMPEIFTTNPFRETGMIMSPSELVQARMPSEGSRYGLYGFPSTNDKKVINIPEIRVAIYPTSLDDDQCFGVSIPFHYPPGKRGLNSFSDIGFKEVLDLLTQESLQPSKRYSNYFGSTIYR